MSLFKMACRVHIAIEADKLVFNSGPAPEAEQTCAGQSTGLYVGNSALNCNSVCSMEGLVCDPLGVHLADSVGDFIEQTLRDSPPGGATSLWEACSGLAEPVEELTSADFTFADGNRSYVDTTANGTSCFVDNILLTHLEDVCR